MGEKSITALRRKKFGIYNPHPNNVGPKPGTMPNSQFMAKGRYGRGRRAELDKLYRKHVKYFYLASYYSKDIFYVRGDVPRQTRTYAMAIMDDDYQFHYIEFKLNSLYLTTKNYRRLKKIFLSSFFFDENSSVILDNRIPTHDLVWLTLSIMQQTGRYVINKIDISKMYVQVDKYFGGFGYTTYGEKKGEKLYQKMLETDMLNFLPGDYNLKKSTRFKNKQTLMRDCAIGILYSYKRDVVREKELKNKEKRRLKKGIINQASNKEQNNEVK